MATVAVAEARAARAGSTPAWRGGLIGVVGLLVVWEIVGLVFFRGRNGLVPPPTRIVAHMFDDGFMFYWHNARDTLYEAFVGWLWGNVLAIGLSRSRSSSRRSSSGRSRASASCRTACRSSRSRRS